MRSCGNERPRWNPQGTEIFLTIEAQCEYHNPNGSSHLYISSLFLVGLGPHLSPFRATKYSPLLASLL